MIYLILALNAITLLINCVNLYHIIFKESLLNKLVKQKKINLKLIRLLERDVKDEESKRD